MGESHLEAIDNGTNTFHSQSFVANSLTKETSMRVKAASQLPKQMPMGPGAEAPLPPPAPAQPPVLLPSNVTPSPSQSDERATPQGSATNHQNNTAIPSDVSSNKRALTVDPMEESSGTHLDSYSDI